jgi:hypothetical protein
MEATVVPSDDSCEEGATLVYVDDDFESVYDVPYVTVNRIGGEYLAEVVFSGDPVVDKDRVSTALAVGRDHGVCSFARVFGENCVTIHFTDDPSKGLIWGLEDELGNAWLQ